MMAVMLILFDIKTILSFDMAPYTAPWATSSVPRQIYDGDYTFVIDNFIIDKHTCQGLQEGAGRELFVHVGAVVVPEDSRFIDPLLKRIYTGSAIVEDEEECGPTAEEN